MRVVTMAALLALALTACATAPPDARSAAGGPGGAGDGAAATVRQGGPVPGATDRSAGPATRATLPERTRAKGFTSGQPALLFFDADG